MPSLQRGSSAISTFPLHLVLYEGVTYISMVSSERKYLFHFCLRLTLFLFLLQFFTPLFLAMLDFLPNVAFSVFFFPLAAFISTGISSLNMQPPALTVIE